MGAKRLLFAGTLCLLLSGMRDPFQPPPDTCQIAQLTKWHFHGVVLSGQTLGILRDANGRWQRVAPGDRLATGWRIIAVTPYEIAIATGEACNPAQWRWQREGTHNEKMAGGGHAAVVVGRVGASAETGYADAG